MTWLWVAIAVALDGADQAGGAALPDRWLGRYRTPMLGFAAGALLASGVVEILPDAYASLGPSALGWVLAAFAVLAVIERVSARRGHHRDPVVPASLLGSDALHNIGDGMAIAAAFLTSTHVGIVTSGAVIVHEVPEEIADYALLRTAGMSRRAAMLALAAVQLSAGIGAAGTLVASSLLARGHGAILAIAGGTFVYIAAVDLLPELVRARRVAGFAALVAGAALAVSLP
jgi:zinc and cadmium transporter